jgi:outer membrane receptor protein involved in Fe transport
MSIPLASAGVRAQAVEERDVAFDIAAGSLQSALVAFGSKTGWQLIYAPSAVAGWRVGRLQGHFSPRTALEKLIGKTGLHIRQVGPKIVVIEALRASVEPTEAGTPPPATAVNAAAATASDDVRRQEIIVTGSNIRGEEPAGSHVRTIRKAEMDRNGYTTVAQALQALPGNFGGVATEQSSLSYVDRTASNATASTGINLRGLGAGATLVLVNGHRLAGAGNLGDFADISNIPTSIVDRVEVLMDGASAIYGSDAVGGVVNIIMKDHFEGFESGARFGTVTNGGMRQFQAYQNAGKNWGTGNVLLSYEYYEQKPLLARQRRFAMSADSRPLGGTDHRNIYSLPGNILGYNPATRSFGATYAIPAGQNGTALQPGDFIAGQANRGDPQEGAYLIPRQTRHSIYASVRQDLSGSVHASLEGRFTHRDFEALSGGYITILSVTPNNPWFVSPTGRSSELIGYNFGKEIGPTRESGWSQSLGFTGSLDVDLPKGWKMSAYAGYAQSRERHLTDRIANEALLSEALGTTADDPSTAYSPARDGYFNPYGDGSANSAAVLAAIGSGYLDARNSDYVTSGNIQADGPLFALPAGAVRIAFGANVRREVFDSEYTSYYYDTAPTADAPIHYGRTIGAGFAEARIPLFGPANARPGFRRLDLSLAGRVEHYPDFGMTANPKVGVTWSPLEGLSLRGSYGTSFRAPNLSQLRNHTGLVTTSLTNANGASMLVLQLGGGNPDLKPERARSWTLGADVEPSALPGLRINATLFRTIFDRRIDRPAARDFRNALINPDLAPFVRFVSPASTPADRAYVNALIANYGIAGRIFPVDRIAAVVDARYVNTGSTDVRGVDFTVGYTVQRGADSFSVNANGTWLIAWRQQVTPTSIAIDQRNRAGQPVDFKGRMTAGWQHGGFDALAGLNYVNAYRNILTGAPIRSWTTFDARIAWTAPNDSWLRGTTIALAAQNIFDSDPPFYDSAAGVGYDAANSDATGRFVSLQLTKRW